MFVCMIQIPLSVFQITELGGVNTSQTKCDDEGQKNGIANIVTFVK